MRGSYYLTHSVIALQWAIEQGCVSEAEVSGLKAQQEAKLLELIGIALADHPVTDIFLEALATLYYGGHASAVRPEWIKLTLDSQLEDGSFPSEAGSAERWHSTVLAMWALLAQSRPDAPPVTMIPPAR